MSKGLGDNALPYKVACQYSNILWVDYLIGRNNIKRENNKEGFAFFSFWVGILSLQEVYEV